MRGLILAAGLGERMRPLSALRPKPALPVRGLPVAAYGMRLLARHGVTEAALNTHHLPDVLRRAVEPWVPPGLDVTWSHEVHLLGTGGALRRLAAFLVESDPCLVLAGDMLLDADLSKLADLHHSRGDAVTFLLRKDARAPLFGTIGVDAEGRVRRIGRHFDLGGEVRAGVYAHATLLSARALAALPEREAFNHLTDWIAPLLAGGAEDIRAEVQGPGECLWEPVGIPREYLRVNLHPPGLSYADSDAITRETGTHCEGDLVVGSGASLGEDAVLERAVVWDGERVPAGLRARGGVFAGGVFHPCEDEGGRCEADGERDGRGHGGGGGGAGPAGEAA